MKPNSETANAITGSASANEHFEPGHWFFTICNELSSLRARQRERELAHFKLQKAYAGDGMVNRG